VWPFVRTFLEYDELDSTSDRAAALVRLGISELPLAVWCRRQTRGRGRRASTWWSDAGSLTFTVAIDPAAHCVTPEREPSLALVTSVAAIEALGTLELGGPTLGIRWPNDVEADGRKLGGILPEAVETARGRHILIGVGLNVFTRLADAPEEVRTMATSLAALHGGYWSEADVPRLLAAILTCFESALVRLVQDNTGLAAEWNRLDLLAGRRVRVDLGTRIVSGIARGIDAHGALCLDDGREPLRLFGGRVLRE
jgi:BirA family biotin operon repressor/biotin-[acetyl-CoA-carboxylase] ligase